MAFTTSYFTQSICKFRDVKILTNAWHAFSLQGGTCFLFTSQVTPISGVEMAVLLTLLWRTYSTNAGESGWKTKYLSKWPQKNQERPPTPTELKTTENKVDDRSILSWWRQKNPFTSIKAKDTPEKVQNRKVSCQLGSWNKDKKISRMMGRGRTYDPKHTTSSVKHGGGMYGHVWLTMKLTCRCLPRSWLLVRVAGRTAHIQPNAAKLIGQYR